ncbi:hypothetical protein J4444_05110 [Candidatus Woesearchaeota archaeon]|nr:hypothetical protein [Candidatus Woesearchaeota archaeon]
MKKIIFAILVLMVISMFLVSCGEGFIAGEAYKNMKKVKKVGSDIAPVRAVVIPREFLDANPRTVVGLDPTVIANVRSTPVGTASEPAPGHCWSREGTIDARTPVYDSNGNIIRYDEGTATNSCAGEVVGGYSNTVRTYYCGSDSKTNTFWIEHNDVKCNFDSYCSNGRCVQGTVCVDPDSSVSYSGQLVRSTVTEYGDTQSSGTRIHSDKCVDSTKIKEYFCLNNKMKFEINTCPTGKFCNEGACVPKSGQKCVKNLDTNNVQAGCSNLFSGAPQCVSACVSALTSTNYEQQYGTFDRELVLSSNPLVVSSTYRNVYTVGANWIKDCKEPGSVNIVNRADSLRDSYRLGRRNIQSTICNSIPLGFKNSLALAGGSTCADYIDSSGCFYKKENEADKSKEKGTEPTNH